MELAIQQAETIVEKEIFALKLQRQLILAAEANVAHLIGEQRRRPDELATAVEVLKARRQERRKNAPSQDEHTCRVSGASGGQ